MTYIERKALLEELGAIFFATDPAGDEQLGVMKCRKATRALPAADVVPVKRGRWEPNDMGGGEPDEAYICSICGEAWTLLAGTPKENNMNYCPRCGAKMDMEV